MDGINLDPTNKLLDSSSPLQGVNGTAKVQTGSNTPVYSYGKRFTPAATPTDVVVIQGSASKTLKIQSVILTAESSAAGIIPVSVVRRTAANTGGTSTQLGYTPHDISDAAATAGVFFYSANPSSLGAVFGAGNIPAGNGVLAQQLLIAANSGSVAPGPVELLLEQMGVKPWILRGTSDFIAINFNGAALPAGIQLDIEIDIEEDNS